MYTGLLGIRVTVDQDMAITMIHGMFQRFPETGMVVLSQLQSVLHNMKGSAILVLDAGVTLLFQPVPDLFFTEILRNNDRHADMQATFLR